MTLGSSLTFQGQLKGVRGHRVHLQSSCARTENENYELNTWYIRSMKCSRPPNYISRLLLLFSRAGMYVGFNEKVGNNTKNIF